MHTKKYVHLTQLERDRIEALLNAGHKQNEIAKIVGRNKSTISREIKLNQRKKSRTWAPNRYDYDAGWANIASYNRRKNTKYQGKKINDSDRLRRYIVKYLKKGWSPDDISGRMRLEHKPFYVSKTAIYEWLYSHWAQRYCQYLYSQRYRPKKRKTKKLKKVIIPNRKGIETRPPGATNKTRYGHYEGDTMVSGRKTGSKSGLTIVYERKAKFLGIKKIRSLRPGLMNRAVEKITDRMVVKSLTLDNGVENQYYEELGIPTYFCDAYSSWQKGGVENANKLIRRYIPKGTDIGKYSDEYVSMVEEILNNKPRKSLGYKTPLEVMEEHDLLI